MADVFFPSKSVKLALIPGCDLCVPMRNKKNPEPAKVDSPVEVMGRTTWAYTCSTCYAMFATSNSSALGTRLEIDKAPA